MTIEWNKVTWYSKLAAVVLFVGVFILGIYFGREYEKEISLVVPVSRSENVFFDVVPKKSSFVYTSPSFGFSFEVPNGWNVREEGRGSTISMLPPEYNQGEPEIEFNSSGVVDHDCPVFTHSISCEVLSNSNGVQYVKSVSTGQLALSKQAQLDMFFLTKRGGVQASIIFTDSEGKSLPYSEDATKALEFIMKSVKLDQ